MAGTASSNPHLGICFLQLHCADWRGVVRAAQMPCDPRSPSPIRLIPHGGGLSFRRLFALTRGRFKG